jgi:3-oxoadipate enol-lactonase
MMSTPTPFNDIGNGCAVVLLHGFPFNRSMWTDQVEFFSAHGYRAVAPDLRGFEGMSDKLQFVADSEGGETEREAEACRTIATMDDMARDVAALMDKLRIDSAVICGLSMGCYVALEFIHLFPSRARALILCGPKAQGPDETEKINREALALRLLAEGMNFAVASISKTLLAQRTLNDKPDVVARVREMIQRTDPRGAAAAQRGMAMRRDYSNDLAGISVPTLIIAGREDGVRKPEDAEFIAERIPNSELIVIDDAGHLMNMERPEIFSRVMLELLGTL